jgi:hypothetical protein
VARSVRLRSRKKYSACGLPLAVRADRPRDRVGLGSTCAAAQALEAKSADGIPLFRISQALDVAGAALARGEALPAEALQGMARVPIPYMPRPVWHRLFMRGAASYWQTHAASHGLSKADMLAAPLGAPAR